MIDNLPGIASKNLINKYETIEMQVIDDFIRKNQISNTQQKLLTATSPKERTKVMCEYLNGMLANGDISEEVYQEILSFFINLYMQDYLEDMLEQRLNSWSPMFDKIISRHLEEVY